MNENEVSLSKPVRKAGSSRKTSTVPKCRAVIVLGMHRSGTSVLTRVLNMLGCTLPAHLMGATPHNPTGHWESNAIMTLNDDLLAAVGSAWDDWLPLASHLKDLSLWNDFVARGRAVLKEEYGNAGILVLKDPRVCRLAPFWFEVLEREEVEAAIVLPLRHPLEVARSLATRDNMDEGLGLLLWLRYVLDAEAGSRGRSRTFVKYVDLLGDWEAVADTISEQTGVIWPRKSALTALEIEQFITPELRHHISADVAKRAKLPPWAGALYDILLRWAQDGEDPADYLAIDAIADRMAEAALNFARPLLAARSLRPQLAERGAALEQMRADRDAVAADRDEAVAVRDQVSIMHNDLSARLEQIVHAHDDALASLKNLTQEKEELSRARDEAASRADALAEELNQLRIQAASREKALQNEIAALEAKQDQAASHADRLEDELSRLRSQTTLRERELRDELATSRSTLRQREEEVYQSERAMENLREEHDGKIAEMQKKLDKLNRVYSKKSDDLTISLANEKRRFEEIGNLTRIIHELSERANDLHLKNEHLKNAHNDIAHQTNELNRVRDELVNEVEKSTGYLGEIQRVQDLLEQHIVLSAQRSDELEHAHRELNNITAFSRSQIEENRQLHHRIEGLQKQADQAVEVQHDIEWLRRVSVTITTFPWWWKLMPKHLSEQWQATRLKRRGLFDADEYCERYSDVAQSGMSPLRHYLLHGMDENRSR